jgi:hypothetical protein
VAGVRKAGKGSFAFEEKERKEPRRSHTDQVACERGTRAIRNIQIWINFLKAREAALRSLQISLIF